MFISQLNTVTNDEQDDEEDAFLFGGNIHHMHYIRVNAFDSSEESLGCI